MSERNILPPFHLTIIIWTMCQFFVLGINSQLCKDTRSYVSTLMTVTCYNISEKFPSSLPAQISFLKCIDCNIPVMDENTINGFGGDAFNLSYSHVRNISSTAFASFASPSTCHRLLFHNNDITHISTGVFKNFTELDELNLKYNNISSLEEDMFRDTKVSTLDLSYNHITNITGIFAGLKVSKLNLSSNRIVRIEPNDFDDTTFWTGRQWRINVQQLDLSNNLIEEILVDTFKFTTIDNILRYLFLNRNKLRGIHNDTFIKMSYLRFLSLEENYISELYTDSFKGLSSLNTLILKNNNIVKIPVGLFADMKQLEFLDLSQNSLTTLTDTTFTGLAYLTKLNISHNDLRVIDEGHILPLGRLISLDISDTAIRDINLQNILEHHYKLRVLVLNDNFWTCKKLVQMYKMMNEKTGGFDYPTHHFNVPNLHGIACSRVQLDNYDEMTFKQFLDIISQDRVFEDLFDSRLQRNEYPDLDVDDLISTVKSIHDMFYLLLVITIIIFILFVRFVLQRVCYYLCPNHILGNSKYSFKYNSDQDNVILL